MQPTTINKTFSNIFPDANTFFTMIVKNIATPIGTGLGIDTTKLIDQNFTTALYGLLRVRYNNRPIRYDDDTFINLFAELYVSSVPSLYFKTGMWRDKKLFTYTEDYTQLGQHSSSNSMMENDTDRLITDSTSPYNSTDNKTGDDKKDTATSKNSDIAKGHQTTNNARDVSSVSSYTSLSSERYMLPLLKWVGTFNNLFIIYIPLQYTTGGW